MNILFLSRLSHSLSTGPAWSVPARVEAQDKIDNVMWINTSPYDQEHWKQLRAYHNIREFGKASFAILPPPFNSPDVVIFEGFYGGFVEIIFAMQCWRKKIPYIIVPRSSLTYQAMHNSSRIKKELAHFIFFDYFVKRAKFVQYLTKQEYEDSKYRFDIPYIILPNGIKRPDIIKTSFSSNRINGVFIGRMDIHQKGLDLLLDVIAAIYQELQQANFSLKLYGPMLEDYYEIDNLIKKKGIESIVALCGEVYGEGKRKVLLEADVFFLTSRFEGHPMGLLEALSYGLPCVVTDGSNMRSKVDEFQAGWTCDFSMDGLSKAMLKMIKEQELFMKKSRAARDLSLQYEWDILSRDFQKVIYNAIG